MRRSLLLLVMLSLTPLVLRAELPARSRQLILVTTADWESVRGEAQRYARRDDGGWETVGAPTPVLVGRNGMAWGVGLHGQPPEAARVKREGDGRAPAGVFALGTAFGFAPREKMQALRLPYLPLTEFTEAIDDPASRFYNQIVDRRKIRRPDWRSSEMMRAIAAYELGLVVAHNPRRTPGAGSCIFLHLWLGEPRGSAGCTLLRPADFRALLAWLDERAAPVLVQAPRAELSRLGLPFQASM